ncbi:hypothetical protein [uncultured Jatrophihabitans sp.]|uniref:hypothetical protein n=1 Tax=uncultured Jatrophihabitans sp. TaxID=1610747 RepID=UPI0035CC82BE
MATTLVERLVTKLAGTGSRKASRRGFLAAATLTGTALAVDPWGYLTKPQSAYASVCGPGASCSAGWSAMCCSINNGQNTCPPNTYPGGWWKADRSSFCGGAARYYIDCNAKPGHHFHCHCNQSNCDHRYVACNVFRYGQCNTQVHGVTAVVCRQISCLPPWQLYPGKCGHSSATDNNTAKHNAPCLTKANTYPRYVTFPKAEHVLHRDESLRAGQYLTSTDQHTTCVMQADGNFVIRNERGVIWQTRTAGVARGGRVTMQANGRLAVLDVDGVVRWQSPAPRSSGRPAMRLDNDGRMSVWLNHGTVLVWRTNTRTP